MEIKLKINVNLPSIPNFITIGGSQTSISIKEFTDKELIEIGKLWTQELVKKAKGETNKLYFTEKSEAEIIDAFCKEKNICEFCITGGYNCGSDHK